MAHIEKLTKSLIKSTPAVVVESFTFDKDGLYGDREFLIVEDAEHINIKYNPGSVSEPGAFLSQREDPKLTQIMSDLNKEIFSLSVNDFGAIEVPLVQDTPQNWINIRVWGWHGVAIDLGATAADFLSEYMERPVRLVSYSRKNPRYAADNSDYCQVAFADQYPVHVISQASVDQTNLWLKEFDKPTIPADRFRANIIIGGVEAFSEDFIAEIQIKNESGSVSFIRDKACARCPIPDIDQTTGEQFRHLRSLLGKKRRGKHADLSRSQTLNLFYGQYYLVKLVGEPVSITREDHLEVVFSDETNWVRS